MHLITCNVNTAFREMIHLFETPLDAEEFFGRVIPIVKRSSRNGNVMMIDEPVTVTYTHPRERVLFNLARNANPFFHLYHALWMLAGRNDVGSMAYYNKRMTEFSDDGKTLNGAYGYRWRRNESRRMGIQPKNDTGEDQLDILVSHLKSDPTSRRAVLQMWNVEDDLLKIGRKCPVCNGTHTDVKIYMGPKFPNAGRRCETCRGESYVGSKDVCCNLSVMFSIRDTQPNNALTFVPCPKYLDMTVTNRSNDLIWGMLGEDFVTFSVLQEYVAARLGVEVGRYNHFTNNLHVYDWNWKPEEWLNSPYFSYEDPNLSNSGLDINQDRTRMAQLWGKNSSKWIVPLVKDPVTFDDELPRFVERFSGKTPVEELCVDWKEPFLMDVAQPMLIAFACHKERDYNGAFAGMDEIAADDWRIAATNWLRKRSK